MSAACGSAILSFAAVGIVLAVDWRTGSTAVTDLADERPLRVGQQDLNAIVLVQLGWSER